MAPDTEPELTDAPADSLRPGASDRGRPRLILYWILGLALVAGAVSLGEVSWRTNVEFHALLEALATILAAVVGWLALVRFYSRKQATFLFIGTGFLGTALLDAYHALITSPVFDNIWGAELPDYSAWSWTASRAFLALFIYVSWLAWRRERWGSGEKIQEGSVYATAVVLTLTVSAFFLSVNSVSTAHYPDLFVSRPGELLPAFFFLLALAGYLGKGRWRRDPFEHWLVLALLISVAGQALYMSRSDELYDAFFDLGHALKLASYFSVLGGLMASVYVTFRREGRAFQAVRQANEAMAQEMEVRREAEQVLQESEERLQDFLDNAHDLIQSVAPDGRILYVNRSWRETLGYSEEELEDLSFFDVLHPGCADRCREDFRRVLEGEPLGRFEVEFLTADGDRVVCSGTARCRYEHGRPVATQGIFRDVTDQKRAERELAASQANLAALVENTGDAIWSVDRDHRLITFNSAFALAIEARTGREPREGDPPEGTFPLDQVDWFRDLYDRTLDGERLSELLSEDVAGEERHSELFFNPIEDESGITGAVIFGQDVTRRIRAEQALRMAKEEAEAANRAKSHFLASMSHELRTPLNSVIGFTNILLKNKEGNLEPKQVNFLNRVLSNGRHLLTLINEVLDLAKIEAGRMELEIEEVDLAGLVRETVQQLEGQVASRDVELRADVPPRLEPVKTDAKKLKQVLINLVGNALKFTEEGEVAVRVSAHGRTPTDIAVSDTGIGISEERLEAIFEAFQQAEAGTSRKYGGTGLGLAISRSICQLLGYDMSVESEVGEGSTFTIGLSAPTPKPAAEHPEEAVVGDQEDEDGKEEQEEEDPRLTRVARDYTVLVIDDESDSRVLMQHYLEEFGCRVLLAESGDEGLELARREAPDLITLDLMMPGLSGWETLELLKNDPDLRTIPVVVVSIVAAEGRKRLLGAVDLVTKPVEREDILRVLWRNLSRKRGGHVLVVEDEADDRAMLEEYLRDEGIQVTTARDGKEGLRTLGVTRPDAVILDLLMPEMGGMEFLGRIREMPEYVGLPVIVLTARELDPEERDILERQASEVISKGDQAGARLRRALSALFPLEAEGDEGPDREAEEEEGSEEVPSRSGGETGG